ncbi:MAG: formate dehydrogenase subunit alpha [Nitrospirae bacterium]|nr:formate dehydrogenase subunit alpha [Nitrospirota bacterium]
MEKFLTVCPYCGCGCGIYLHVEGRRITGVSSSRNHPVNRGSLCVKGWNSYEFVQHPERLRYPMIRENGSLRRASWKEALGTVAERLNRIKKTSQAESIGILSSAKCTNEENYLMMKFARAGVGTNNIDHCARLCHSATLGGLSVAFGAGAMTNSISEIRDARVIFVIGSNVTEQYPMVGRHMLDAVDRGATLIVADPRRTQIAELSHLHLRHRCGTDVALLLGIMNVIIEEGHVEREFVRRRTENFDAFEALLNSYPPETAERITGVSATDIRRTARIYATERRSMLFYSMGITQHITGSDNVRACADIVMLTGHIGLPMSGLNPLRGQNNVQGACDMGALPDFYSGYQPVSDIKARRKFERAWRRKLPETQGLTLMEMLNGNVKAMLIMGENPALSDPDLSHTRHRFEELEFLAVQDIFFSETCTYADVILPSASFAEKTGTFTNTERRIQLLRKAIEPPGEAMPDWQIICELSGLMGYGMHYRDTYEIMEEIALLTPSYGGIRHHRLEGGFGIQWPCPDISHLGTAYLHRKKFARGLGSFITVGYKPPSEVPDAQYPFLLTTGRLSFQYHTGTMSRRTCVLERDEPICKIEINPEDALTIGIKDKSPVKVSSRRAEIKAFAELTERVPKGTVFIPFHFRESAGNLLTSPALDPCAKIPELKVCAVKVEASDEHH